MSARGSGYSIAKYITGTGGDLLSEAWQ